jgi:hypothetical protein
MYSLIASAFFQKKQCCLPGLGELVLQVQAAQSDFNNAQILAPNYLISFIPESKEEPLVYNEFSAITQLLLSQIQETGEAEIEGLGVFYGSSSEGIQFAGVPLSKSLVPPMPAIRVVKKDKEHPMLVGDKVTTNLVMTEVLQQEEIQPSYAWMWWAFGLFAASSALLAYYWMQHYGIGIANAVGL